MIFLRRKLQNRRLGRGYVLDVKLRSSQVRAVRLRWASRFAIVLGGVTAVLFLGWWSGSWAIDHFLYQNPAFATRQIDLETDGVIAVEHLKDWAGVKPGDNLLALDLAKVKHRLERIPFIRNVSLERVLPHTLRVRVSEREPIAQVPVLRSRSGGGTEELIFNVDAESTLMPPLDPRLRSPAYPQAPDQLPLITGCKILNVRPGQNVQNAQVDAALKLLVAFDHSSMAPISELKKIDASAPDVLTVTTGEGSEITFGMLDFERQLRRWHEIQQTALKVSKAVRSLDLAVSNHIPALWVDASTLPPQIPKPPKMQRSKKKHV